MSDSLITSGAVTQFWANIDKIQTARLALIEKAQHLIQFETFLMTPGDRAEAFAAALQRKATEGVRVQLLADSYGAKSLPKSYWQRLRGAGVEVKFFNPFSGRSPLDYLRRNHRKLLIVDQQIAMIGGAGIADCWDGKDQSADNVPWYDFEMEWQGAVVALLVGFFWQHWLSAGGQVNLDAHQPSLSSVPDPSQVFIAPGEDPSFGDSPIRSLFQLCILSARSRLWIASPYLLPEEQTCEMLGTARQNGVDVRILTMGPKSDKRYVYYVARERYGALLKRGIKIHEYQPSMMHAKIVLVDDQWVSLGSANLDPRSYFHNDELNLCTPSQELVQRVEHFFEEGFSRSQLIQHSDWQRRSPKERVMGRLWNCLYWQL
ncbi:phospholipase D-like domain-containing protein [Vacuolonema iberomarrocanum]|uniref:phospholipase D-like domain-containing protein n=1 Tax=Vacuolonema iberomarrocanum TaxID=3454632 RepID=UPI003F6DAF1B